MSFFRSFINGSGHNSSTISISTSEEGNDDEKMEELKTEIENLRSELSILKDASNSGTATPSRDTEISTVAQIKMQAFYESDPELWFLVIESHFESRKITKEKSKYLHVVGNLNCATATQVKDVIKTPFTEGHYEKLKAALISIYAESSTEKFRKLISNAEIGDQKPSQFLHHMKSLADTSITDDFIKKLWIQRLPSTIRAVLSASNDNLDNLAKMADQMWEVSDKFAISSIKTEENSSALEKIVNAIEKLTNKINALERKEHVSRRNVTPQRSRSYSKGKRERNNSNSEHELCWYHFKFGDSAKKCREPCKFETKN